jgi:hypothetical protein
MNVYQGVISTGRSDFKSLPWLRLRHLQYHAMMSNREFRSLKRAIALGMKLDEWSPWQHSNDLPRPDGGSPPLSGRAPVRL